MEEQIFLTADGFPLVRDIGWNQASGLYTHPDRLLDYEVFIYVTQGSMQVIEEGTEYVVQAGEYLFLREDFITGANPAALREHPGTGFISHPLQSTGTRAATRIIFRCLSWSIIIPIITSTGSRYPNMAEHRFSLDWRAVCG